MAKLPTRSPTHQDIELSRLAAMGLEVEEIADGDTVELGKLVELAEDRGRPPSHYLAATALATELHIAGKAPLVVRVCAGTCQRYGALDLLDHLVERRGPGFTIAPVSCLDRCDQAPACEVQGAHGQLVIAPATVGALDEALSAL
jgi:NADH:ubiquinone oxidoreductase subunit E